jgi:superfamily II DNA helicase RecQ
MFIALTATATSDTRKEIFEVLDMTDPFIISESPNKPNISYVVQYMPKTAKLSDYFTWIVNEVVVGGVNAPRTIIARP